MLSSGTSTDVFTVAWEAALLPHGLVHEVLQLLIGLRVSEIEVVISWMFVTHFNFLFICCFYEYIVLYTIGVHWNLLPLLDAQDFVGPVDPDDPVCCVDKEALAPPWKFDALDGSRAAHLLAHFELRNHFHILRVWRDDEYSSLGVASVNMLSSMIVGRHYLNISLQRNQNPLSKSVFNGLV